MLPRWDSSRATPAVNSSAGRAARSSPPSVSPPASRWYFRSSAPRRGSLTRRIAPSLPCRRSGPTSSSRRGAAEDNTTTSNTTTNDTTNAPRVQRFGPGGFGGDADEFAEETKAVTTDLSKLGNPGDKFTHDFFVASGGLTFDDEVLSRLAAGRWRRSGSRRPHDGGDAPDRHRARRSSPRSRPAARPSSRRTRSSRKPTKSAPRPRSAWRTRAPSSKTVVTPKW